MISESEVLDEDNFFYGGLKEGDSNNLDEEKFQILIEKEPLVGSTLNLFKLSGRNLPTETEKYESSSVYQTPELNP